MNALNVFDGWRFERLRTIFKFDFFGLRLSLERLVEAGGPEVMRREMIVQHQSREQP